MCLAFSVGTCMFPPFFKYIPSPRVSLVVSKTKGVRRKCEKYHWEFGGSPKSTVDSEINLF